MQEIAGDHEDLTSKHYDYVKRYIMEVEPYNHLDTKAIVQVY